MSNNINVPAGFLPVPDYPSTVEVGFYSLPAQEQGIDLDAAAVIYPERPDEILYFFDDTRTDMTAKEAREFVAAVNDWWHKCETYLQGGAR